MAAAAAAGGGVTGRRLLMLMYATVLLLGLLCSALFILSVSRYSTTTASIAAGSSSSSELSAGDGGRSRPLPISSEPDNEETLWSRPVWEHPPPGTGAMPPRDLFRLTKERVARRVKDNVIILATANYAAMDFALNWVRHLTDLNLTNLLVGALDAKLLEALYWRGVPVIDINSTLDTELGWGTPAFHNLARQKDLLINAMLPFGFEILACDTDMVWLKNPLPYFARYPEADIFTSTDHVGPTSTDDSLNIWQESSGHYNTGLFHWRPTNPAMNMAQKWKEKLLANELLWDQQAFNDLLRQPLGPGVGDSELVYAFNGTLKLGILPATIFCNGHTYFTQQMPRKLRLEPYAVHATYTNCGNDGKRHRLREAMFFYDPPEYYDTPGGFMSFKPDIPKRLLLEGAHNVETHFNLVNHQMKQIRTALAIASLLNRTLVMPPLWCRLDKFYHGHPGVVAGTMTGQPFLCPLDYIFDINNMLGALSETEFGPRIDFREYSFLGNPLVPEKVKESKVVIQICEEHPATCNITKQGVAGLAKNSNEEMILKLASTYKDVKLLQFSSMHDVFRGFSDKGREEKFRRRVKMYVAVWCCVMDRSPGHIYYDMYWDEKPGWTPKPPEKPEDDHRPL